jgi:hypothetical protein
MKMPPIWARSSRKEFAGLTGEVHDVEHFVVGPKRCKDERAGTAQDRNRKEFLVG